jgi:hypothetical protein
VPPVAVIFKGLSSLPWVILKSSSFLKAALAKYPSDYRYRNDDLMLIEAEEGGGVC